MLGTNKVVSYSKIKTAMENDILQRFPAISKHIDSIDLTKGHISGAVRSEGIGFAVDSQLCAKEALPLGAVPQQATRMLEPSAGTKR